MSKKIRIPVRALGSEVENPGIPDLAAWVAAHHGIEADLITFKLEESLRVQEGVDIPAAGGRFYRSRLTASLIGVDNGVLTGELSADHRDVTADADRIIFLQKGAWSSLPAPHLWDITDDYYHDHGEFLVALCRCTKQLMRTMRDRGIKGHILLCDRYGEEEVEELAGPRVLFYLENPTLKDLSLHLEHQRRVAVPGARIDMALGLLDEFEITRLTVVDPTKEALGKVQSHFDTGSFEAGGYCRKECAGYWRGITDSAFIIR
jgi:hypothetical protein